MLTDLLLCTLGVPIVKSTYFHTEAVSHSHSPKGTSNMISPANDLSPNLHPIDTRIQLLVHLAHQHHIIASDEIQPVLCDGVFLLVVGGTDHALDRAGEDEVCLLVEGLEDADQGAAVGCEEEDFF